MDRTVRRRIAAWGTGACAWLLGLSTLTLLTGRHPLGVVVQAIVESAPGPIATAAIELLGHLALPLLFGGVLVAVILAAVVGGVIVWPVVDPGEHGPVVGGIALVVLTAGLLLAGDIGSPVVVALGTLLAVLPPAAFGWSVTRSTDPGSPDRRPFLRRAGAAAVAVLGSGALSVVAARVHPRLPEGGEGAGRALDEKRSRGTTTGAATPDAGSGDGRFGFDFGGMPARVGDISDHYVVDKDFVSPRIDADEWSLRVGGNVDEPYTISHGELADHARAVDETVTMVCISNRVGGDLISTAEWTGVPLVDLIDDAGVRDDSYDIVTRAEDGYSESIPVEVARREPVLVAIGASGRTLPLDHGFPARLLIPGRYGMKSTKWLTRIEASPRDYQGYWEQRGWNEEAVINTLSYIRASDTRDGSVAVGGVAYAGLRGIEAVEVSVDAGETWDSAQLEAPPGEFAWRRWRHVFERPDGSSVEAVVRARDGTGSLQPAERTPPHPSGATGWHRRTISL